MAIGKLTICEWTGRSVTDRVISDPTWAEVEAAIRALDNERRNDIYLTPDPGDDETYLCIGGGNGRYVLTGAVANEVFPTFVDPSSAAEPDVELVAGGQSGLFPANWVHDLETTIQAARTFFDAGRFPGTAGWIDT